MKVINLKREKRRLELVVDTEIVYESVRYGKETKVKFEEDYFRGSNIRSIRKIEDKKELNDAG